MLTKNLALMNDAAKNKIGMDFIIISTSNAQQKQYWQERLEKRRGNLLKENVHILTIEEDWPGGAGNGLGTLYAYVKGRELCLQKHKIDLLKAQKNGASIAIYHTAGQGTRLSPLTASEHNNKPGVKLPGLVGNGECITILEAVLKQTAIYAPARKGRLSVFWGDQIFIPSKTCDYQPTHAIDLLIKLNPMSDEKEWKEKGLDKYGLVALDTKQDAQQIDKADYGTIQKLVANKKIATDGGVGISLGSFSLSTEMTVALLEEFKTELLAKTGKMDVEPHIWMATTLDAETYQATMLKKGVALEESQMHQERMLKFKKSFIKKHPDSRFFGAVDVGHDCYWWDYGTIDSYIATNMRMIVKGNEADAMRTFYQIGKEHLKEGSCLVNCSIESGIIKNSVLVDVTADKLNVEGCLIIDSELSELVAKNCMLYSVIEKEKLDIKPHTIRADVNLKDEHLKVYTHMGRDGKEDWKKRLEGNKYSYEELHEMCKKM